ncbi:MAG: vWA domain-containing protein [Bacteroidales bacterium]
MIRRTLTCLSLNFLIAACVFSQQKPKYIPPTTRILFVFDASQSMAGMWESDLKINIARKFLEGVIDSLEINPYVEMALRVYGHQSPVPPQDCSDSKLEVPFGKGNASRIRQKLRFIQPKGTTPIANSLLMAGKDFPPCANCRNVLILITDGIEACDGDPCKASDSLQRMGIVLKPFVIGIGIDEGLKESFGCIGQYINAKKEDKFKEALNIIISQALNSTTAQVNLLDQQGNPSETNVNMTFYDIYSGKIKYNYYHTINNKGNPDTIILDPLLTYNLTVHTLPPLTRDSIKLLQGKHTIIALDAPQGYLNVQTKDAFDFRGLQFFVRKQGSCEVLNLQKINQTEKYLTGIYDLEVPVLPKLEIKNVEIKQSSTTTVEIPRPGIVNLFMPAPGFGSIYTMEQDQLKSIYLLNQSGRTESIMLLPGHYWVVFRALNAKQAIYTITREFDVKSGSSIGLNLE